MPLKRTLGCVLSPQESYNSKLLYLIGLFIAKVRKKEVVR